MDRALRITSLGSLDGIVEVGIACMIGDGDECEVLRFRDEIDEMETRPILSYLIKVLFVMPAMPEQEFAVLVFVWMLYSL